MPGRLGFTLVELLITISIIAILSAIAIASYSQLTKNARDAKRQSDLKQIQSALEQYRADQGFYPSSLTFGSPLTNCTGNPASPCNISKTYLKEIPHDPQPSTDYRYAVSTNDYCLYARVENPANARDTTCRGDTARSLEVTRP